MKKRFYALVALCVMVCGLVIFSTDVNADESLVEDVAENVLQEGGLLEAEGVAWPKSSAGGNVNGAKAAMVNAAINLQDSVDLKAYNIPVSQIENVFVEVLNENPRLFYIDRYYTYRYSTLGYVNTFNFTYADNKIDIPRKLMQYDHEVNKILSQIPSHWTDMEKILFINEYIALNCSYYEEAVSDRTLDAFDAYNVFVDKKAVCQGYALAVEALMDKLGIPCELVTSNSIDHAWNMVKMNGKWYHMDVTWNDPIHDKVGRVRHFHLLKSYSYFRDSSRGDHFNESLGYTDYVYTGGLTNASAYTTTFDNCFWDSINTPFVYLDGYWYNIVQSSDTRYGNMNKYYFTSTEMILAGTVMTTSEVWRKWNDSSYYWYYYGECISYNGALYYSTPTKIMRWYPNGSIATLYELTQDEKTSGNIYGFSINPYGELQLGLGYNADDAYLTVKTKYFHAHVSGAAATCTTHQTCTKCDKILNPAKGHIAGAPATCTTNQVCTRAECRAVLVAAKGHAPNIPAPTCSVGQYCTTCGTTIARATGHVNTYKQTIAATFKKAKKINTYCSACNLLLSSKTSGKKLTCKKGAVYTVGNYKYKIISNKTNGNGTVAFHGLAKNVSNVVIGSTVTIKGAKFNITQISAKALRKKTNVIAVTIGKNVTTIGKEAFYGTKKLKTITVKSTKLKTVGKNALKSIYKKAKIKVPKSRLSKYKKLFKGKGQKSSVKITK